MEAIFEIGDFVECIKGEDGFNLKKGTIYQVLDVGTFYVLLNDIFLDNCMCLFKWRFRLYIPGLAGLRKVPRLLRIENG